MDLICPCQNHELFGMSDVVSGFEAYLRISNTSYIRKEKKLVREPAHADKRGQREKCDLIWPATVR
jgi:hypothetical protein